MRTKVKFFFELRSSCGCMSPFFFGGKYIFLTVCNLTLRPRRLAGSQRFAIFTVKKEGCPGWGGLFRRPAPRRAPVPVKTVVVLVKTIVVLVRTGAALVRFSSRTGLRRALSAVCGAVSAILLVLTEVKNVNVNRALRGSVQKGLGARRGVRALLRCRPSCGNAAGCLEKNDYLCPENP